MGTNYGHIPYDYIPVTFKSRFLQIATYENLDTYAEITLASTHYSTRWATSLFVSKIDDESILFNKYISSILKIPLPSLRRHRFQDMFFVEQYMQSRITNLGMAFSENFVQNMTELPANNGVPLQRLPRNQRPEHIPIVLLVSSDNESLVFC